MSPRFVLGRENVPCVAEVVNRSLKADCTDFTLILCSISQDCIPLLGFETRYSFELILCNLVLMSKVIFVLLQTCTCNTRNWFSSRSLKSFLHNGVQWKKYKAKSFL